MLGKLCDNRFMDIYLMTAARFFTLRTITEEIRSDISRAILSSWRSKSQQANKENKKKWSMVNK